MSSNMEELGGIIRRRRQELGLSQAELARAAEVHLRQVRRYESGEQQPVLPVAVRLATALGVTVNDLAGQEANRVQLDGTWWAAWQTFNEGNELIATQPLALQQHGSTVEIRALERSSENEQGGYLWRGELRLWDEQILMGWYTAADANVRSKGTIFFVLHAQGEYAEGRWVGLSYDAPIVSGHAVLAQSRDEARSVMDRLTHREGAPT